MTEKEIKELAEKQKAKRKPQKTGLEWQRMVEGFRGFYPEIEPMKVYISIKDAKSMLRSGMDYFCGGNSEWLDGYDKIAEWLADNKGKGLILKGDCGLGKSVIATKIVPLLLQHYGGKIMSIFLARDMNKSVDEIKRTFYKVIDDVGTENKFNDYGDRRYVLPDIIDDVERKGGLLLLTTNLKNDELAEQYGARVIDRLHGICKSVTIQGNSQR